MSRIFAQLFWISFLGFSADGLPPNVMRDSSKGLTDVASIFAAIKAHRAEPTLQFFAFPATNFFLFIFYEIIFIILGGGVF